jgi:phospholipid-translocating ATPase
MKIAVFPQFGATSPQTAALPLIFIICVTAIKDGVEDYRRATLDEEVNNSAATKLGDWRNVNIPTDPRGWFEKALGLNAPGKVTKGIRKLREREAGEGMQIILNKTGDNHSVKAGGVAYDSSIDLTPMGAGGRRLDDIQSVDSHRYPPNSVDASRSTLVGAQTPWKSGPYSSDDVSAWNVSGSISSLPPGQPISSGVVDYRKRTSGQAKWERTLWKKLEVGDIVLLRDNSQIPADILVLSTSDPEGVCFVETKNLDGETNLKPRKSIQATANIASEEDLERSTFILDTEAPHQNLYVHHGVLRYTDIPTGQIKQESVTINELLLRGCTVRNTDWVIGLVVYTGADSKIMLNGGATPSKRSKIEKETNFNVIVNFVVLMVMCLVTAICNGVWESKSGTSADVFEVGAEDSNSVVLNSVITFVYVLRDFGGSETDLISHSTCLIAFQNIVPISLYISIEIVKTIQAFFISQDIDMYYKPLDTACVPKTWNISDDLGQIEYVFSDKTGTLTQNVMEFQKCSVNGIAYGEGVTEAQRGAAKRAGKVETETPEEQARKIEVLRHNMLNKLDRSFKNRYAQPDRLTLVSPQLAEELANRNSEERPHLMAFFKALAICHSVLSDRPEPRDNPFFLNYKAESPDEAALVAAACDVGFPFVAKGKDFIDIEALGQTERYTPLKLLEFNSTRKRMSVIIRNPQGRIVLYCKGADSVIYERLAPNHDPVLKEKTANDMEAFANGGLRTLCIAYRYLEETEYMEWSRIYDDATNSINDREEAIDNANAQIEHSLHILGATALEDKLQEGVPDAIEILHQAGIKLWILTGDKVQTAIEIGGLLMSSG